MSETSRFIVQKCGQEMESPPNMLEHIVLVHNDPDAAQLLQEVQVAATEYAYSQGLVLSNTVINCKLALQLSDALNAIPQQGNTVCGNLLWLLLLASS